jgi:hypothetical protein
MKFVTIITPLFLCASLASAAKKPKLPKNGGGGEEESTVENQVEETGTGTAAAAQSTDRDV